jgi:hypothetical protein
VLQEQFHLSTGSTMHVEELPALNDEPCRKSSPVLLFSHVRTRAGGCPRTFGAAQND